MELTKGVLLFVLAALATTNAFNTVTPWNKEVIYKWHAQVRAGTFFPASFASQFELHGKIHVQANNNATHVKITDLTHKIYNGIMDHVHEHEAHNVPVTHEIQDLHQVFKIVHDTHGHAIGIVTEDHEKEFSRNMKRAIASILQVDDSVVKQEHHRPHAFVTKEHSIYGYGSVDYNIIPHHDDDVVEVHKFHDMRNPNHLYQHFFTNTEPGHCNLGYEEQLMHDSMKKYIIVKQDGHRIVKRIEANGVIYYYPYQAKSDAQFIIANQSLELVQVVPVQDQFHVQSEHYENDLTYHTASDVEGEAKPDLTNGRHVVNHEKLMPHVKNLLQEVHQYLQQDHIHTREPHTKQGKLINRIKKLLEHLTVTKLQELHKSLSGESVDIFYHILPLIGTKASALYIKHLVINKEVNDEIAVELLQHLPEHIFVPTVDLVHQLEELIHLGDNIHWNVRRVAILSFASLIHKSHRHHTQMYHNKQHKQVNQVHHDHEHDHVINHDLEEPYEKYVIEYINKIRSSQEYKVQMAYILALSNMRLHSIIKHMVPAFNGEWWHDRNLRFLSLWPAAASLITDPNPDTIIETLWPIMTDREEHTEIRLAAYFFFMESQPSHSRLKNVFKSLYNDPNEEVYHFHYTYVHSMMQTNDPCRQEFRLRLAQLAKFMHPPSHGLSSVHLYDFKDTDFGFSGGVQNYFIKTNVSQIYTLLSTSQNSRTYHEDYMIYVKVHGMYEKNIDPTNILVDLFRKKLSKVTNSKDVHIEVAILKHGLVLNSYYFDEHNLHELSSLLDFFTKESHSFTKDFLHMSYHRYHHTIIPTDLGIPATFEYFMPVVHQNNISISTEVANRISNVHVHNRYVNWIHYWQGLTFYNPFFDVWQGVNRMHAYDAVVPLHFDISLNTQQQSLQISWKKHDNPQMNVAGLRSHVRQYVFVYDEFDRNPLLQSSPNCKEWEIVTNGKEFRNDYTLLDEDDLNTGHKWHVGVYDCGLHITNGSFNNILHHFTQTDPKHFESPLSHLLMTYSNWNNRMLLLPRAGIYGFIVRVEPSHEHVVSNIDISLRVNNEIAYGNYYYTPGSKWSSRLTYAVKNKEQSLKTWDVNAIVDMNPGHTVNSLKMHLTRIVPGQKDYKICVDGVKKWTQEGVTGHLNVAMSQTPDGKCIKDDTVIDVTMTGQRSHEQDHEKHFYGACHYVIPYSIPHYHTLHCLAAHTSLRHYVYNVKTTNVPTEFRKTFEQWWDHIKGHYMSHYNYQDEHNDNIGEHNLKVDVVYPMQEHALDVHVTTPNHVYSLTGVPTNYWRSLGLIPDSTVYSPWFMYLHEIGLVDHCVIHHDHHTFNHHQVQKVVPNDWTLYVGDIAQNPVIYIKHVADDKIAIKAVDHGHTLEIVPHGENHQITVDGQVIPEHEQHHEDWVHIHAFTQDVHHPVAVMLPKVGIHFEYDGHHVVVLVPKVEQQLHGLCYSHH